MCIRDRAYDGRAGGARIDKARIDAALRRFVDAGKIVGASALVVQDLSLIHI